MQIVGVVLCSAAKANAPYLHSWQYWWSR